MLPNNNNLVKRKIAQYHPRNGLSPVSKFYLALLAVRHEQVKEHSERVALLAEAVAAKLKTDKKAAFFGGLFHDVGKLLLPAELFDGREISEEEYTRIKEHAIAGFKALKGIHFFTAMCAGLHHALYKKGYGLSTKEFPDNWHPSTIKKVLEISTIISVCDFIDAANHRKTKFKSGPIADIRQALLEKYPGDERIIDIALKVNRW